MRTGLDGRGEASSEGGGGLIVVEGFEAVASVRFDGEEVVGSLIDVYMKEDAAIVAGHKGHVNLVDAVGEVGGTGKAAMEVARARLGDFEAGRGKLTAGVGGVGSLIPAMALVVAGEWVVEGERVEMEVGIVGGWGYSGLRGIN